MQGWLKYMNIYQGNTLYKQMQRKKSEKAFNKIQQPFILIVQRRSEIQGIYLNIIIAIYSKPTPNIKLNGEKLEAIPLKSGTHPGFPFSPYLFNLVPEVLARKNRQQKEVKGIQIGKEEVKVSLFADDMRVYISDPKILQENFYT